CHIISLKSKFGNTEIQPYTKSDKKYNGAKRSKKMHGFFTKTAYEHNGYQIQKALYVSFDSKFGGTVFPCMVFDYFFSYIAEPTPFGYNGDVTMHLTIDFNGFYHFL